MSGHISDSLQEELTTSYTRLFLFSTNTNGSSNVFTGNMAEHEKNASMKHLYFKVIRVQKPYLSSRANKTLVSYVSSGARLVVITVIWASVGVTPHPDAQRITSHIISQSKATDHDKADNPQAYEKELQWWVRRCSSAFFHLWLTV